MRTFEISVSNFFDADDEEDAVRQMVAWLVDSAPSAGYRVTEVGDGPTRFIDADDLQLR